MSELLPCPFCGGEVEIRTYRMAGNDGFSIISLNEIYCDSCRVSMMQPEISEEEAAAAWNTRHVETVETCRNVDADQGWFGCSECGCICSVDWYGSGFGTPNFCPSCGRRVEQ